MKGFPAVPVLNIQACPLVKEDFSCMQIPIGRSYMQLGDKEQSKDHEHFFTLSFSGISWMMSDSGFRHVGHLVDALHQVRSRLVLLLILGITCM